MVFISVLVILGAPLFSYVTVIYNSDLFWNHTWKSAQWLALYTKITEVNSSILIYRLCREVFTPLFTPLFSPEEWSESFTKQPVDKYISINFCNLCVIVMYNYISCFMKYTESKSFYKSNKPQWIM